MPPYFVDFEGFQHGDGKIKIKELCILDASKPLIPLYYLFRADKKWNQLDTAQQQTYKYQTNRIHQIEWDEGVARYCKRCIYYFIKLYFPLYSTAVFYVMGEQKLEFLREQFPDLNFYQYPITMQELPLIAPNFGCVYREHGEHCACKKCYRLLQHYLTCN